MFEAIAILKPVTSRPTSSERYLYCQALRPLTIAQRIQLQDTMWKCFQCDIQILDKSTPNLLFAAPCQMGMKRSRDVLNEIGGTRISSPGTDEKESSLPLAPISAAAVEPKDSPLVAYMEACANQQLVLQVFLSARLICFTCLLSECAYINV